MLVDPRRDCPHDHIRFREVRLGRRDGQWIPMGLTDRGRETIRILKLHNHIDLYTHWIQGTLKPRVDEVMAWLSSDVKEAGRRWEMLKRRWYGAGQRYRLLTWSYLDDRIAGIRQGREMLPLSPPAMLCEGARSKGDIEHWKNHQAAPEWAREAWLMLGARATKSVWAVALKLACQNPRTVEELSRALKRSPRTVTQWLDQAVGQGLLTTSGDGTFQAGPLPSNPNPTHLAQ